MKKTLVAVYCCLLFAACGNGSRSVPSERETTAAVPAPDYRGTYVGTLPAADGPGIATTLTLGPDSTFALRSVYIDREATFIEKGTYTAGDSLITLRLKDGEKQYYKAEDHRLRRLDADKREVTGVLAGNYVLAKVDE